MRAEESDDELGSSVFLLQTLDKESRRTQKASSCISCRQESLNAIRFLSRRRYLAAHLEWKISCYSSPSREFLLQERILT